MLKKLLIALTCTTLLSTAYADTCPSVAQIKQHQFDSKTLYFRDSGEPATKDQQNAFVDAAQSFSLGYFLPGAPEGEAQCYYKSASSSDYLPVYIALNNLQADEHFDGWTVFSDGRKECRSTDVNQCHFKGK